MVEEYNSILNMDDDMKGEGDEMPKEGGEMGNGGEEMPKEGGDSNESE